MTQSTEQLHVIRIDLDRATGERCSELLDETENNATLWIDAERDQSRIEWFFDDPAAARNHVTLVRCLIDQCAITPSPDITISTLQGADWSEAWKRFFHTTRVSERIVIKPSWETYMAEPGDCVITIDPGMSFGTGNHATTRACLRFLDQLASRGDTGALLDAGCGSGILAIAAAKLGFGPVIAFDSDPDAIPIAKTNAAANNVADRISFLVADLSTFIPPAPADVVTANILAPVLIANADRLRAMVRPGGALLLAGILTSQFAGLMEVFDRAEFVLREMLPGDEWTSGWLERG